MWTANLFQVTTGNIGPRLNFESLSWSIDLNDIEAISISLKKSDLPKVDHSLWLSPWWAGVVIMWNNQPIVAGPIIANPNETAEEISLSCGGIRSVLAKRLVSIEQTNWSKLAKSVIFWNGLSLGTIAKRAVQQAQAKYAGNLPITYAVPEETAAKGANHQRTYRGFNVQNINCDDILTKLSNVTNGPDIMFKPRLVSDNYLTFDLWTGTERNPRIYQKSVPVWDTTAPYGHVEDIKIVVSGSTQSTRVYSVGAGQDEGTLIKVNTNLAPLQKGYPLLETVVTTSSSEDAAVVNEHGISALWANREPLVEIQMTIRGDGEITPFGEIWPGDLVDVIVKGWRSLPDGVVPMRLLNVSGNEGMGVKVSLQTEAKFTEDRLLESVADTN